MGVPDYSEVLVKAAEPYLVGEADMTQLSQEESARWFARQGKSTPDCMDDSEGLFEDDEDVIMTEGRALPRWLVSDDYSNMASMSKYNSGSRSSCKQLEPHLVPEVSCSQPFIQSLAPQTTQLQFPNEFSPITRIAEQNQYSLLSVMPTVQHLTPSQQPYTAQKFNYPLEQRRPEEPQIAHTKQTKVTSYEQSNLANDILCPVIDVTTAKETADFTTKVSFPTIGGVQSNQKKQSIQESDMNIDHLLNTPKAPSNLSFGTPLQDELQLQITDYGDPLYQEAFGPSNPPPAKKAKLDNQNIKNDQETTTSGKKDTSSEKSELRIEFEEKKELTTAEAIMEAAKMICKALDDNTRVARCAEKATVKIAGELERIERRLTKMERVMTLKAENETPVPECKDLNNNKTVSSINEGNNSKEADKCKKKDSLKSVVQQIKRKK